MRGSAKFLILKELQAGRSHRGPRTRREVSQFQEITTRLLVISRFHADGFRILVQRKGAAALKMVACEEFWNWFAEHETELLNFEDDQERIFDELAAALQKVDPDLTFEFGPRDSVREFVVSAGGIKRAFPAVSSLVAAAPSLARWKVIAFRPRRAPSIIELGVKRIDPDEVSASLIDNGKIAGIYLFIPGFDENDTDLKQIGYLLLDEALGEYDVETKVGPIGMYAPEARTKGRRFPLAELPYHFDRLVSRLAGRPTPIQ